MAIGQDIQSDADHVELLERLITSQGVGRHGIFLLSGEGRFTPDGFEETSGYVIDSQARVFFFWTGWNEDLQRTALETWRPAEIQADWHEDEEFRAARKAAGLS